MENFIRRPDITVYPGIRVTKDTVLEYKNENVKQSIKNLTLHSVATEKGEGYRVKWQTTIDLKEGDILVLEENGRGYIKPVETMVTAQEAIEDLEVVKNMG